MSASSLARPASAVTAQSVAWLWPGRLALGKLALLDGDPELGKTTCDSRRGVDGEESLPGGRIPALMICPGVDGIP